MAKEKQKMKFFKLRQGTTFYDAVTGLKLVNKIPGKAVASEAKKSKKIQEAKAGGHIEEIEEGEYEKLLDIHKSQVNQANDVREEGGKRNFASGKDKESKEDKK